jgi:hypothetical protein
MNDTTKPKFELGQLCMPPAAIEAVPHGEAMKALSRHVRGDWGDVCAKDAKENDFALGKRLRIFSVDHTTGGPRFWIITEADRSVTTLLLPEDY